MVQRLRSQTYGPPARAGGAPGARASQSAIGARRDVQPHLRRRWRSPGAASDAALAFPRIAARADRRDAGEVRVRGGFRQREGVRGTQLHPDVRRPHEAAGETVVQHGDLRQPRQAGRPPRSGQEQAQPENLILRSVASRRTCPAGARDAAPEIVLPDAPSAFLRTTAQNAVAFSAATSSTSAARLRTGSPVPRQRSDARSRPLAIACTAGPPSSPYAPPPSLRRPPPRSW